MFSRHACHFDARLTARHINEHTVEEVKCEDVLESLSRRFAVRKVGTRVRRRDDGQRPAKRVLNLVIKVVASEMSGLVEEGEEDVFSARMVVRKENEVDARKVV